MHSGARLYKIPLLENKATCKVMNLIKLAHRHLNGVCAMLVHVLYNNLFIHVLCCFILTVDYMSVEHYLIVWCRELSIPIM